jgi:HipA-like protein
MDVLNVYLNERHVGRLSEADGVLSFIYLPEYVAQGSGEPLSLSLPVRASGNMSMKNQMKESGRSISATC